MIATVAYRGLTRNTCPTMILPISGTAKLVDFFEMTSVGFDPGGDVSMMRLSPTTDA